MASTKQTTRRRPDIIPNTILNHVTPSGGKREISHLLTMAFDTQASRAPIGRIVTNESKYSNLKKMIEIQPVRPTEVCGKV